MEQRKQQLIAEAEYELFNAGFAWITANNGVHLQVLGADAVIADIWPTTGKWRDRLKKRSGVGLVNLLKGLEQ